eukprot:Hpha_TRINITY_DN15187_c1_g2::TRINITY_DN15187_c1_g2_i1::g.129391::m.129391/K09668/LARGE; glycosyltransferase-like protein LARGE
MRHVVPWLTALALLVVGTGGTQDAQPDSEAGSEAVCGWESPDCGVYRSNQYNTTLFSHRRTEVYPEGDQAITLCLHLTTDRLPALRDWCKAWRGPMSVAVYVRPQDETEQVLQIIMGPGCVRKHADIHVVQPAAAELEESRDMLTHYPFNVMRNAALDGARTDWVFLLDADFRFRPVPSVKHEGFTQWFQARRADVAPDGDRLDLFIVPAFETVTIQVDLPNTTQELVEGLKTQRYTLFYGHYCVSCHHPTDSLRWRNTPENGTPYEVHYVESFEPYVIASRSRLPPYDERFTGRGWDKMSYFYELDASGARFMVLPRPYFLAHRGRGNLPDSKRGKQEGGYTPEYMRRQDVNNLHWIEFKRESLLRNGREVSPDLTALLEQMNSDLNASLEERVVKGEQKVRRAGIQAQREAMAQKAAEEGNPEWSAAELDAVNVTQFASASLTQETVCIARRDVEPEALQAALEWVCGADEEIVNCSEIRHFPDQVVARCDWAFDRWYQGKKAEEGDAACVFGGNAELTTCTSAPQKCVPVDGASEDEIQDAIEWVCGDGLGSCGWTMEGGPHYMPNTQRHHAAVAFTLYFLVNRCAAAPEVVCDFKGLAKLEPVPEGWDRVLDALSDPQQQADEEPLSSSVDEA